MIFNIMFLGGVSMKAVGNSVIGMRRTNNEDAIYINEQKKFIFSS